MREKVKLCLWLAYINLFISAFTFGGGYVVVPMIRKYFVRKRKLFDEEELIRMAAIAQSTPGAIAVNMASLAGYRAAGMAGLVISGICSVIPPLVILAIVSKWYAAVAANTVIAAVLKGMQAGVAALIVDFVVDMTRAVLGERSLFLSTMTVAVFVISFLTDTNIAMILLVCCGLCAGRVWFRKRGEIYG
ncbi:chromate transporter [Blautia pseudococcoides]|uniref:chromate transporter n=1 Tax=Blautia pseudococcoides TaxID=1796616 RepID=UPI00148B3109|nr:chromate transporter [Blautia pseudococcoides]QJU14374.1 chromate transporter [Blautia pseudococcoides]